MTAKTRSLSFLFAAQVAALTLWFSATAVAPDLTRAFGLSDSGLAALSLMVQLGFVAGCLLSAAVGLADRIEPRVVFAGSVVLGAGANLVLLAAAPDTAAALGSRFAVGFALAGVYPTGMKLAAGWADRGDMGLLVGLLVGALTLGSAAPHFISYLGGVDWRAGVIGASVVASAAAGLIFGVSPGPGHARAARFALGDAVGLFRNRASRLLTFGYLGHMWELYAGWAWISAFVAASFALRMEPQAATEAGKLAAFAIIGVGAVGSVSAGWLADRIGRTAVTSIAMSVSAVCCLAFGLAFGAHPAWMLLIGGLWGMAVIADSAQFSAGVAEVSAPERLGSMLTLQTALGFALTAVSIRALPIWVEWAGWRWAFAPLALGPVLGTVAMLRLRSLPEAKGLAGGRR